MPWRAACRRHFQLWWHAPLLLAQRLTMRWLAGMTRRRI
jgi:hypothetical protein